MRLSGDQIQKEKQNVTPRVGKRGLRMVIMTATYKDRDFGKGFELLGAVGGWEEEAARRH